MRYWVARASPAQNTPFERWIKRDSLDPWWTKKPPRSWNRGDRVFIWASSPQQEIVGLAELYAPQGKRPDKNGAFHYRIRILTDMLPSPIPRRMLERNPILKASILLKHGPSMSVVRLTDPEGEELYRIVVSKNPSAANVWPDIRRTQSRASLLQDLDLSGKEGSRVLKQHLTIERDRKLVEAKKQAVLSSTGTLACEVCGFDFEATYGPLGKGFSEAHHLRPLGFRDRALKTTLDQLAIVCSNCHRVIHRKKTPLLLDDLRAALQRNV